MKARLFSIISMVSGGWLAAGVAWADPEFPVPAEGGLPACEAEQATCEASAQAFLATGQTSWWDAGGNQIPCNGTGHDGEVQAGAHLSYRDAGLTIIDNNTKLEWIKLDDNNLGCGSYPGNLDKDCLLNDWDEAFTYVESWNAVNHAGGGWRVPNKRELASIQDFVKSVPPLVSAEFNTGCVPDCTVETCSCTGRGAYSSSTSSPRWPDEAAGVDFVVGVVFFAAKWLPRGRVRAVRGPVIDQ